MSRFASVIKLVFTYLFKLIPALFGEVSWQPPRWIKTGQSIFAKTWLGRQCEKFKSWASRHYQQNPRRFVLISTFGVVSLVGLGYGVRSYLKYLDSLPKPAYVKVNFGEFGLVDEKRPESFHLVVSFSHDVAQLEDLAKPKLEGISISPKVAGTWKWQTGSQLVFIPDGISNKKFFWPAGQKYTVQFPKELFAPQWLFESYKHEATTTRLRMGVSNREFYIDPTNTKIKKVLVSIYSNYPLDVEDFKKRISMEMRSKESGLLGKSGESKKFSVSFDPTQETAYIESELISLPKEDHEMLVKIAKGAKSSRGGEAYDIDLNAAIEILGLYNAFKIDESSLIFARNEKYEPEQVVVFSTRVGAQSEDIAKNLEIKLLPKDRTIPGQKEVSKDHYWSLGEATPDVISKSEAVQFQMIPTEEKYSKNHSFKIHVPVGRMLLVKLKRGVKGIGEYELGEDYHNIIMVEPYPRELMFMSKGVLLNQSGSKKIPALARNISTVKIEIARIIDSQVNHILAQMISEGEIRKSSWSFESIRHAVVESFSYEEVMKNAASSETSYFSVNLEPYIKDGRGLFVISMRDKENSVREDRLVMVTDFGIIAKQNVASTTDVFVQNLRTGAPVSGANVEVMGANGIAVLTFPTDESGRAKVPNLKDFKNEKQPIAFVVKKAGEVSYLPYQLYQRTLNFSRFDVGGVYESSASDKLSAMMFSDRGLYRPGEKVQIAMILRSKNAKQMGAEIPLMWTVTNSKGNMIFKEKLTAQSFSMNDFSFSTDANSPTGDYTISLFLIKKENNLEKTESLGQLVIKVEEFVPDQMKIVMNLSPARTQGWVQTPQVKVQVNLTNLFGTPAENRRVTGSYRLIPSPPNIPDFKEYHFYTVQDNNIKEVADRLVETTSNAEGYAEFEIDLKQYKGFYLLQVVTDGYQAESGKSVSAVSNSRIGHLPYVVGYKADGDLSFMNKDATRTVHVIGVGPDQKKTAVSDLKLVLLEKKYVSSLIKDAGGNYRYQSVMKEIELQSEDFKIGADGVKLKLPTEKAGEYVYSIRDSEGFQVNRISYSVMGDTNVARSLERSSELQIALNKKDYKNGEEIEMQIKAPYEGAGLITIERDQVYQYKWFQATDKSSVQRIKVPEGVDGNAYITVTMLRSFTSNDILISPLSYGVAPFSISLDEHRTSITLKAPERLKPGQNLKVKYSASKETKIVLYGVDEGILLVAGYKLPDPLSYFFSKKSLQVKTFQVLDLLLPDISRFKEFAAPGGDEGMAALGSNLNPFKKKNKPPVVFWSGVLSAGQKEKEYVYQIPEDFNGAIKIMAVTSGPHGLGSSASNTISRGDFIISPTLPSVVSPGDQFFVGVNVSNQVEDDAKMKDLELEVTSSKHFEIVAGQKQDIEVEPGREKGFEVQLKALKKLGTADLKFRVSPKGKKDKEAKLGESIGVRPSVPYFTSTRFGLLSEESSTYDLQRNLFNEYSVRQISVSPIPAVFGTSLIKYLSEYPYGCTEQLVSKAIPYLLFDRQNDFQIPKEKAKAFFDQTIAILRQRQTSTGGFGLYSGADGTNVSATLYAIQYLLAAREAGHSSPDDLLKLSREFLDGLLAQKDVGSLPRAREYALAIYLKARMELVASSELGFLLAILDKNYQGQWEHDSIAALIAGSYAIYKMEDKGRKLISKMSLNQEVMPFYMYFYDQLARDGVTLQIVSRHYPKMLPEILNEKALTSIVQIMQRNQYNSYSSAQLLLAFNEMLKTGTGGESIESVKIAEMKTKDAKEFQEIKTKGTLIRTADIGLQSHKVQISGNRLKPLFYSMVEQGFDVDLPTAEIKNGLEIQRSFLNDKKEVVQKVKRGETIEVSLKARSLSDKGMHQVVLVDLFPSGFEVVVEARVQARAGDESTGDGDAPPIHDGEDAAEGGDEPMDGALNKPHEPLKLIEALISKAYAQSTAVLPEMSHELVDYRDDRVVIYGILSPSITEFKYKLKAINRGQFVVPPTFGESMYDRQIQYRGLSQTVTIE